jgi:hypothetical protein
MGVHKRRQVAAFIVELFHSTLFSLVFLISYFFVFY